MDLFSILFHGPIRIIYCHMGDYLLQSLEKFAIGLRTTVASTATELDLKVNLSHQGKEVPHN